MKVTTCRTANATGPQKAVSETIQEYRKLLSMLIPIVDSEWDRITIMETKKEQQTIVEMLVHGTKSRTSQYPTIDSTFPKFPSYLRRAAIREAIGHVSSYRTRLKMWKESGASDGRPELETEHKSFPAMFRGNTLREDLLNNKVLVKLKVNDGWSWVELRVDDEDAKYLRKLVTKGEKLLSPTLRLGPRGEICLDWPSEIAGPNLPVEGTRVVGVDLGITHDAVLSVVNVDGSISARKFISHSSHKNEMHMLLNKTKKSMSKGGKRNLRHWARIKGLAREIAISTAIQIVDFAVQEGAQVIVFENLQFNQRSMNRSMRARLHMWKYRFLQEAVQTLAWKKGVRIARINPKNTSKLAYDGSGEVLRGRVSGLEIPHSMCLFPNGRTYNCDLNASYNIGARYIIRQLLESLSVSSKLAVEANVPRLANRTTLVLSDLISLGVELGSPVAFQCVFSK